ncbi:MAG: DNA polymerase III subunit beta [Bacilli bacterium]
MKLKIKRELLLEGLNKVSKAISTKNLIPVLSGIKFELSKEGLVLTASDNDIFIQYKIEELEEMEVIEEGSIIIQGKYIIDIVRKLSEEFINIEVYDDLKILIYTPNSEFNLNGIKKEEYPIINLEMSKNPILINIKEFKSLVNQTSFATATDETRVVLTGVNIKIVGNILECNSTDSYRLARKIIKLTNTVEENYNIVIPSKNIIEFSRLLSDSKENMEIHIFNNKILFKDNNLLFQSRLINGTYPNTSNLIPDEALVKITVNINDFYDVIDRASILTSEREKNIVMLETIDNMLYVRSFAEELGRVEEKMLVNKNNNENIKISFSAKYMIEALKSFEGLNVELAFLSDVKPIIIKDTDDEGLIQLVLPIRTY